MLLGFPALLIAHMDIAQVREDIVDGFVDAIDLRLFFHLLLLLVTAAGTAGRQHTALPFEGWLR